MHWYGLYTYTNSPRKPLMVNTARIKAGNKAGRSLTDWKTTLRSDRA